MVQMHHPESSPLYVSLHPPFQSQKSLWPTRHLCPRAILRARPLVVHTPYPPSPKKPHTPPSFKMAVSCQHLLLTQMHHPEGSPLALCDSCPRSFHLLCMGVEWEELAEGDWACPRCAERKGIPTKRLTVDDVKNRQSTGNGR